jgi:SET domain-containing protein
LCHSSFSFDASSKFSGIGRYANDNWLEPNCTVKKKVLDGIPSLFLFTTRAIDEGEELQYDYGDDTAPWR